MQKDMYLTRMMMRGRCIPYSLPQEGVLLKLSSWNDPFLFFFFDDDVFDDDDNVYYYICERLKLEGETEKMGVRSGRA
jgi:hypothetical protein